jgi:peroxiredoxin
MKHNLALLLSFLIFMPTLSQPVQIMKDENAFRVTLSRIDNEKSFVFNGFIFDKNDVAEVVKKYPVKLPEPLPMDAQLGYFSGGPIFAIKQKVPNESKIKLTLDTNANFDLTDDGAIELANVEKEEEATIVKIARHYTGPPPHIEWLPYRIWYNESKSRDGKLRERLYISDDYRFSGEFRLENQAYTLQLIDGDARGRFVREKLVNVFISLKAKDDQKPGRAHRFFELMPIGDALYEIKNFAEDGSWIDFVKSALPPAALGKPAPDMELTDTTGRKFRLSDYRSKMLLLDFWPSWCVPCVAEFTEIKKTIEKYAGKPLVVIGINIDEAARLEQARKVIAEKQLPWPQVLDGKGQFIPIYQVYGRLPEQMNSFPAYVAIDRQGIARYATNDFKKMARFLAASFTDETGGIDTLFIPLTDTTTVVAKKPSTVDFSRKKAEEFLHSHPTKVPQNLPKEARIGLMSNGTLLVAYPGSSPDKVSLIVDSDRDLDLTNNETQEIPVVDKPNPDKSDGKDIQIIITYASNARSFYPYAFFAKPVSGVGPHEILFFSYQQTSCGSFFEGDKEYQIELEDPTPDLLFTEEDMSRQDILKLKIKKDGEWIVVHQGIRKIPIGERLYRLRFVSDDGYLVELEREK